MPLERRSQNDKSLIALMSRGTDPYNVVLKLHATAGDGVCIFAMYGYSFY